MKVFFTTTPRLKESGSEIIDKVYTVLEDMGHTLTNDYLKTVDLDEFYKLDNKRVPVYYEEILDAIRKADVIVFETSLHSIGVGLLIREALALGKGVIAIHLKGKTPFFLEGMKDDRLVIYEYSLDSLREVLESSFQYVLGRVDVRFNFFISPEIGSYLDWISKKRRIPRAVYLRRLIEREMKENTEYRQK